MREFNGKNIKGKCRKRIIKGMGLNESVVDRKKRERNRKRFIFGGGETIKATTTIRN